MVINIHENTLKFCDYWEHVETIPLTINERVRRNGDSERDKEFTKIPVNQEWFGEEAMVSDPDNLFFDFDYDIVEEKSFFENRKPVYFSFIEENRGGSNATITNSSDTYQSEILTKDYDSDGEFLQLDESFCSDKIDLATRGALPLRSIRTNSSPNAIPCGRFSLPADFIRSNIEISPMKLELQKKLNRNSKN